jgi:AcrR family transcriptional regulator
VEAHQAVVAATAALLREGGLPAVTIDTVSARSGVSKPTIYRYWPNRTALAIDVFGEQMTLDVPIADTGDARGDLTEQVRLVARYYNTQAGTVISQLIGACTTDPQARERLRERASLRGGGRRPGCCGSEPLSAVRRARTSTRTP